MCFLDKKLANPVLLMKIDVKIILKNLEKENIPEATLELQSSSTNAVFGPKTENEWLRDELVRKEDEIRKRDAVLAKKDEQIEKLTQLLKEHKII